LDTPSPDQPHRRQDQRHSDVAAASVDRLDDGPQGCVECRPVLNGQIGVAGLDRLDRSECTL
jgi:hypothetical protein